MAHATLVGLDVEEGQDLLSILDAAKVQIDVAFWAKLDGYNNPRLVLAGRGLDQASPLKSFETIIGALPTRDTHLPSLLVYPMKEPFIHQLRRAFSKMAKVEGTRLGGQTFGGRFLEDGYVYRIR